MSDESGPDVDGSSLRSVELSLYTLAECKPCELIKAALASEMFDDVQPISVHSLEIDDVRRLRKQLGQRWPSLCFW